MGYTRPLILTKGCGQLFLTLSAGVRCFGTVTGRARSRIMKTYSMHHARGMLSIVPVLLLCAAGSTVRASPLEDAVRYAAGHTAASDRRLMELAGIPTISAKATEHAADFDKAAKWLKKRLTTIGLKVTPACPKHSLPFCTLP